MTGLFLLNVIMLTRLGFLMRETPASLRFHATMCALQVLALAVFQPGWPLGFVAAVLIAGNAAGFALERRGGHLAGTRTLVMLLLGAAVALGSAGLTFAPWARQTLAWLSTFPGWDPAAWGQLNLITFGVLILTNEVNLLIRYGFYRLNLEPKVEAGAAAAAAPVTDQRQYNAGRVIGVLERYFIFTLLLAGADMSAIAVILAAKGFARFKQLDRREFAEYVLIGTLASTLAAVLVALALGGLRAG